jgi:hypothetical protein
VAGAGAVEGGEVAGTAGPEPVDPRLGTGTVGVSAGFDVVVVEAPGGGAAPAASSLTTSLWATTGAGRSVTSAATIDVAAHTTAVAVAVTASHSPVAKSRGTGICPGCPFP